MTLFNVVFTASAPLVVGWFDRDLDKGYGLRYPLLYRDGGRGWGEGLFVCMGALACGCVGWFDRDLDKGYGLRFPLLCREGERPRGNLASARMGWWVGLGQGPIRCKPSCVAPAGQSVALCATRARV